MVYFRHLYILCYPKYIGASILKVVIKTTPRNRDVVIYSGAPRRIPSHGTYGAGCGAFVTIWPRLACQIYSLSNPFVRVQILGLAHNKKTTPRNRDVVIYSGAPRRIPSHGTYGAGCGAFVTIWPRLACQIYSLSNPFVRVQILGLAHNKKTTPRNRDVVIYSGAPRRIRTLNLLIRSQMLYPIEPWAQRSYIL